MVVDDHVLLAQSLGVALSGEGVQVVRPDDLQLSSVLDAARRLRPSVVLLDLHLDDDVLSLPVIPGLAELGATVVVVTAERDPACLGECIEAGAAGVIVKTASFEELADAVRAAVAGEQVMAPGAREELLAALRRRRQDERGRLAAFERLTRREREVLHALMQGWTADVMAEQWFVSMATVRSQIRAVLQKLVVHSQLAAVAAAREAGWQLEQ